MGTKTALPVLYNKSTIRIRKFSNYCNQSTTYDYLFTASFISFQKCLLRKTRILFNFFSFVKHYLIIFFINQILLTKPRQHHFFRRIPAALKKKARTTRARAFFLAEWTGLEPATPGVTGRYSNQLNYRSTSFHQFVRLVDSSNSQRFWQPPMFWRPQGDSNPCTHRERVMS